MKKPTKLDERVARLVADVVKHDGVSRSVAVIARGHSQRTIDAAIARGHLERVRRFWIVHPSADAHLRAAARAGVVVSCVTQAQRLGLWVLDAGSAPHVAVDRRRGHVDVVHGTVIHRHSPLVPRSQDDLVDPIENVLAMVAACQPLEAAVAIWDSALNKKLITPGELHALSFSGVARQVRELASPFSDSGLETIVMIRTRRWPVRVVAQVHIAGHDVDFLFGERLVLQVDGKHHVGAQREADIAHDMQLTLMGYHVIRVSYSQVVDGWPAVQQALMRAIAQGLHDVRRAS